MFHGYMLIVAALCVVAIFLIAQTTERLSRVRYLTLLMLTLLMFGSLAASFWGHDFSASVICMVLVGIVVIGALPGRRMIKV